MRASASRLASHIARSDAFIVASKRTPFGAYGGKSVGHAAYELLTADTSIARLRDFKACELGGIAAKAALAEVPAGVQVDQVFFG